MNWTLLFEYLGFACIAARATGCRVIVPHSRSVVTVPFFAAVHRFSGCEVISTHGSCQGKGL